MIQAWVLVAVVGACTIVLKGLGPLVIGGRALPRPLLGVVALLAPTLLAALIVTQAFADGRHLVLDARAAGLGAALVAVAAARAGARRGRARGGHRGADARTRLS